MTKLEEEIKNFALIKRQKLLSKKFNDNKYIQQMRQEKHQYFLKIIGKRESIPKWQPIAKSLILFLVSIKEIKNQIDLDKIRKESPFLKKYLRDSQFTSYFKENTYTGDSIRQLLSDDIQNKVDLKLQKEKIVKELESKKKKDILDLERKKKKLIITEKKKKEEIKTYFEEKEKNFKSIIDESKEESVEKLINSYKKKSKPFYCSEEWWERLNLDANPFPGNNIGLQGIDKSLYEEIIIKLPIYDKYTNIIVNNRKNLFGKSIFLYADYGGGKSTFFDYLNIEILNADILPIKILIDPDIDAFDIKKNFRKRLYYKISKEFIKKFGVLPDNDYNIENTVKKMQQLIDSTFYSGFVIFIDGIHKTTNPKASLEFLKLLQNTIEYFFDEDLKVCLIVAGKKEWIDQLKKGGEYSGSFTIFEEMQNPNPIQAYEMIYKRLKAFSNSELSFERYINENDIKNLIQIIREEYKRNITFRDIIQEFTERIKTDKLGQIKLYLRLNENDLFKILERFKVNEEIFSSLKEISPKNYPKEILNLLGIIDQEQGIHENSDWFKDNIDLFSILSKNNLIMKKSSSSSFKWILKKKFGKLVKNIEEDYGYQLRHYINDLFTLRKPDHQSFENQVFEELEKLKKLAYAIEPYKSDLLNTYNYINEPYMKLLKALKYETSYKNEGYKGIVEHSEFILMRLLNNIKKITNEYVSPDITPDLIQDFSQSWLSNQYLTDFIIELNDLKSKQILIKSEREKYLVSFKKCFTSLIRCIETQNARNSITIIGNSYLSNNDKRILDECRRFYLIQDYTNTINILWKYFEEKTRLFIFNIYTILYGQKWQSIIGKPILEDIRKQMNQEKKTGMDLSLTELNILFFADRKHYQDIISPNWKTVFGYIFRSFKDKKEFNIFIEDLRNLATKEVHNRPYEIIRQEHEKLRTVLTNSVKFFKDLNNSYNLFLKEESFLRDDNKISFSLHKFLDSQHLTQYICQPSNINQVEKEFNRLIKNNRKIDISSQEDIQNILNCDYRTFFVVLFLGVQNNLWTFKISQGTILTLKNIK
ncbi:hypothetical protein DSAG12_03012 [Promethearchaeum syntrophicum]|uniref:Uncharacterized protein n=1 Tax=Promethearchaeum syntrophicum TaxID=2594042 RepID=A0A5B9DEG0_9ARCH|nr:hypothetical protein [Candidatus Prometheoarchaeum syntrophicum]QEE17180.1 hypothetical protein DSAG12_03012 [Candidatus Prometheoarchaeum syntrophicum]